MTLNNSQSNGHDLHYYFYKEVLERIKYLEKELSDYDFNNQDITNQLNSLKADLENKISNSKNGTVVTTYNPWEKTDIQENKDITTQSLTTKANLDSIVDFIVDGNETQNQWINQKANREDVTAIEEVINSEHQALEDLKNEGYWSGV